MPANDLLRRLDALFQVKVPVADPRVPRQPARRVAGRLHPQLARGVAYSAGSSSTRRARSPQCGRVGTPSSSKGDVPKRPGSVPSSIDGQVLAPRPSRPACPPGTIRCGRWTCHARRRRCYRAACAPCRGSKTTGTFCVSTFTGFRRRSARSAADAAHILRRFQVRQTGARQWPQ